MIHVRYSTIYTLLDICIENSNSITHSVSLIPLIVGKKNP